MFETGIVKKISKSFSFVMLLFSNEQARNHYKKYQKKRWLVNMLV